VIRTIKQAWHYNKFLRWQIIRSVDIAPHQQVETLSRDDDIDDIEPDKGENGYRPSDIPRIAGKLAALARMELTVDKFDKATEAVCKDWLLSEMRKKNMRRKDMARVLPWALKFCFIPTRNELDARAWTLTDQYRGLRQMETQALRRRRTWWEFFTLAPRVREELPTVA